MKLVRPHIKYKQIFLDALEESKIEALTNAIFVKHDPKTLKKNFDVYVKNLHDLVR